MSALLDGNAAQRLAKIAGMFGSDHDGERAAAALKFHSALGAEGLTAAEFIEHYRYLEGAVRYLTAEVRNLSQPRGDPGARGWMRKAPHLRHQSEAAECLACLLVSDWEREFLQSVSGASTLSPKQANVLSRIYSRVQQRRAA